MPWAAQIDGAGARYVAPYRHRPRARHRRGRRRHGGSATVAKIRHSAQTRLVQNHSVPRDLQWDILVTACERLAQRYDPGRVRASERRRGLWIVAGIDAPQFALFEPVMRRRPLTRRWVTVVPIQEATARAAAVLREGT
jgi:hypothetical protein